MLMPALFTVTSIRPARATTSSGAARVEEGGRATGPGVVGAGAAGAGVGDRLEAAGGRRGPMTADGELDGEGAADAGRAAGDEDDLLGEGSHSRILRRVAPAQYAVSCEEGART